MFVHIQTFCDVPMVLGWIRLGHWRSGWQSLISLETEVARNRVMGSKGSTSSYSIIVSNGAWCLVVVIWEDGTMLCESKGVKRRWQEYCTKL